MALALLQERESKSQQAMLTATASLRTSIGFCLHGVSAVAGEGVP